MTDHMHDVAQPAAVTDAMVNAAAREMWNDRDARMGGPWEGRSPDEVCVVQTKATARAALTAALAAQPPAAPVETEVQDTWLVGGPPDFMAMSGSVESERVIQLHMRRKATDDDRKWLLDAINAKLMADKSPAQCSAATEGAEEAIRDWWYSRDRQPATTSKEAAKSLIWYLAKCGLKIVREPQHGDWINEPLQNWTASTDEPRRSADNAALILCAKEMPSSLNDACRTIELLIEEIYRLQAAKRRALALADEHGKELAALRIRTGPQQVAVPPLAALLREVNPGLAGVLTDNAAYVQVIRGNVIEECAKVLDEAAKDWRRIRDPGMANNAVAYAKRIRSLALSRPPLGGEK